MTDQTTTVTIAYSDLSEPVAHKVGCSDIRRNTPHATENFDVINAEDIERQVTTKCFDEAEYLAGNVVGVTIKPCIRFATTTKDAQFGERRMVHLNCGHGHFLNVGSDEDLAAIENGTAYCNAHKEHNAIIDWVAPIDLVQQVNDEAIALAAQAAMAESMEASRVAAIVSGETTFEATVLDILK